MIREKYYCDHCDKEIDYQTYENTRMRFQYKGWLLPECFFCDECWKEFWKFVNRDIPKNK